MTGGISESCVVETAYGAARGECQNGVYVWRGIPYAAPPVGDLRFKRPQPPAKWEGVRDATKFGAICPQYRNLRRGSARVSEFSEDCLTLNIWAPGVSPAGAPAADCKKRAVLFFVHGGYFTDGSGSDGEYDGANLVQAGDILLVTINYRLGVHGFMDFSVLDDSFDANCGLWDILAALRWTHENIEAFGGDPDNITVCGQSAGAVCACLLSMNDEAKAYMKRGIMMSGIPTLLYTKEQSQKIAGDFLDFINVHDAGSLLAEPAMELAARQKEFVNSYSLGSATFAPCVDGEMAGKYPIPAASEGRTKGVPLLIGTTREELSVVFFKSLSHTMRIQELREQGLETELKEARQRIKGSYERYGRRGPKIMVSDYIFRMPCIWFAEANSKHEDTWMYRFDYETFGMRLSGLHAFHSSDIPFLFGNLKTGLANYMFLLSSSKTGVPKVQRELRGDFLAFIKTGKLSWGKCDGEDTPARCYARNTSVEQAVPVDVKRAYDGSDFKRRSLEGGNNIPFNK